MFARIAGRIFHSTLNSVLFGIGLMVLVAAYIAIGSGVPKVREVFEMNEIQFFNAWPLKVLIGLLVLNLATVTWTRIPLTPPRYGVWCIHCGIITLVIGTSLYYHSKLEGITLIPLKQTTSWFYDTTERALFVRIGDSWGMHRLPSLPRFKSYSADLGNADALDHSDLQNIQDFEQPDEAAHRMDQKPLSELLGGDKPVTISVLGYYPYASSYTDFVPDPTSNTTAIRFRLSDTVGAQGGQGSFTDEWVAAGDPRTQRNVLGDVEIEHRMATGPAELQAYRDAAANIPSKLHHLWVVLGNAKPIELFVQPGGTYPVGDTGYTLAIERFEPNWPMFGTGEPVKALIMTVTSKAPAPVRSFRRMVLEGKDLQTDFRTDVSAPGPMGARQKAPIDTNLVIHYLYNDPLGLLPQVGSEKHTFITSGDAGMIDIVTSMDKPAIVVPMDSGGTITVTSGQDQIPLDVTRMDHMRAVDHVEEVPPAKRSNDEGESGRWQVLVVRIACGDWSRDVAVPFSQWPLEPVSQWSGPVVAIPGFPLAMQLNLGTTARQLPAYLTLDKFDLVRYPGANGTNGPMRDFRSTLSIEDPATGDKDVEVAHMNSPVYFGDGNWLFFQHSWDADGQKWSIIGVGTRPAVGAMLVGCIMIFSGLLYAFYAKPVVIARMKRNALAKAAAKKAAARAAPQGAESRELQTSANV